MGYYLEASGVEEPLYPIVPSISQTMALDVLSDLLGERESHRKRNKFYLPS
jgi:hypothetical protein